MHRIGLTSEQTERLKRLRLFMPTEAAELINVLLEEVEFLRDQLQSSEAVLDTLPPEVQGIFTEID